MVPPGVGFELVYDEAINTGETEETLRVCRYPSADTLP